MPRRGNRSHTQAQQDEQNSSGSTPMQEIYIHQEAPPLYCGAFLKKNYWEMSRKLEKNYECPICLEDIDCSRCFELLAKCGHHFHQRCILSAFETMQVCPVCRQENG